MIPPAAIICLFILAICGIAGWYLKGGRKRRTPGYEPQHAPLPKRPFPAHAKREFADLDDVPDPDGSVTAAWLRQARDPAPPQGTALDRRPHEHHDRPVPALEALARIRDRIRDLPEAGYLPLLADGLEPDGPEELPREDPFAAYLSAPQPEPDWSATDWTRGQAEELEQWMDENVRSVPVPGADDLDEMARRYAEVIAR